MDGTADALADRFADWVIVDVAQAGQGTRSLDGRRAAPWLATAVAELPVTGCPLTVSAMDQRTPLVQASVEYPGDLGVLPDGRLVTDALGAGSYAVSPITVFGRALGAITIVRERSRPPVTFLELNVLARIADLTAAAIERLDGSCTAPDDGQDHCLDPPQNRA
jgi:GAF domain-containing protein